MRLVPSWFGRHRQRIARLVLIGAFLAVGLTLWGEVPRETELEYLLGPEHRELIELRIAYLLDGEPYLAARFDFPQGAPARVAHTVKLPHGHFQVQLDLVRQGATERAVRSLQTPSEGLVRIRVP